MKKTRIKNKRLEYKSLIITVLIIVSFILLIIFIIASNKNNTNSDNNNKSFDDNSYESMVMGNWYKPFIDTSVYNTPSLLYGVKDGILFKKNNQCSVIYYDVECSYTIESNKLQINLSHGLEIKLTIIDEFTLEDSFGYTWDEYPIDIDYLLGDKITEITTNYKVHDKWENTDWWKPIDSDNCNNDNMDTILKRLANNYKVELYKKDDADYYTLKITNNEGGLRINLRNSIPGKYNVYSLRNPEIYNSDGFRIYESKDGGIQEFFNRYNEDVISFLCGER